MEQRLRAVAGPSAAAVPLATPAGAAALDAADALRGLRAAFALPTRGSVAPDTAPAAERDAPTVYLCGNSLGLQPRAARQLVLEEMDVWAQRGVNGHFDHPEGRPWVAIDETVVGKMARVVGAEAEEVAVMNSLTVNLHLLMVPFYRPTAARYKILFEEKAFPSDHYALESIARFHGHDPADALVLVSPRAGERTLRTEDILKKIDEHGETVAVVIFSGVQYYTGQFFDIKTITAHAHTKGCVVGWDLAHAVGNVPLWLHDWEVDFACWCTYKYLNSGPGSIGGAFVHKKHGKSQDRPRLAGWWGHDKVTRFKMDNCFVPMSGAAGFQLSNPSVLNTVCLLASLNVFEQTTMTELRAKSELLTGYLELLLQDVVLKDFPGVFTILTPTDVAQRGCQLSLLFTSGNVNALHRDIEAEGVICDKREPDVLRIAPVPLYNSFGDVQRFVEILATVLRRHAAAASAGSA